MAAGGVRYFCTAGRGLEPFLAREVRERFGATEVREQPVPVPNQGGPDRWGARPCSLRVSEPSGRGVGCAAACVETHGSGLGSASERVCKERLVPVHGICPSERPCPLASPAELRSALPSSSSSSSISLGGGCGGLREVLPETPSRSGFCVSPEVDCVSGKVFFSTGAEPGQLRKLKSGERLFLLLKKQPPLGVSGSKGKMLHEIKSLVMEEPKCWLDVLSFWRELNGSEGKKEDVSQESPLPLKRKSEEETNIAAKKQKTEQVRKTVSEECQVELGESCMVPEEKSDQDCCTESKTSLEDTSKSSELEPIANEHPSFSFRVSCRCSGAIAKILTSQEIGRAIGIGLMKQFGWRADLRNPSLEIFVHLNDIHFVVGIPLFRLPLANREYISTAGLRSTVAWAMASLAEIRAGAFVLDPMCGLGTILLEAAKEWPEAYYWGADISNSQIEGADVNIRTAGLMDKIGLLKASVKALPLPSESFDAVISDIPFGKKFKITRDIQLLPDILQEMERVLRVGGTIVLLLSKDLHNRMDGITRCAENEPSNAISEGASETTSAKAFSIDGNSSSVVNGVEDSFFSSQQKHFGSLVPDGIYGVSLGRTDAFIHKYRKISTAVN